MMRDWTLSAVSSSVMEIGPTVHSGGPSRRDHDLANDLAVLDQTHALARLFERQHLVDHRLDLAGTDEVHQPLEVVVVEAVRANDLEFEAPDVAQVLLRVIAGGGAADEQL